MAKKYIYCPECGRRICKLKPGSGMEIQCPCCKVELEVTINKQTITIDKINATNENRPDA